MTPLFSLCDIWAAAAAPEPESSPSEGKPLLDYMERAMPTFVRNHRLLLACDETLLTADFCGRPRAFATVADARQWATWVVRATEGWLDELDDGRNHKAAFGLMRHSLLYQELTDTHSDAVPFFRGDVTAKLGRVVKDYMKQHGVWFKELQKQLNEEEDLDTINQIVGVVHDHMTAYYVPALQKKQGEKEFGGVATSIYLVNRMLLGQD